MESTDPETETLASKWFERPAAPPIPRSASGANSSKTIAAPSAISDPSAATTGL